RFTVCAPFDCFTRMGQRDGSPRLVSTAFNRGLTNADVVTGTGIGGLGILMGGNSIVSKAVGAVSDQASPRLDRIDVTDENGVCIGWVDPRSGARNLVAAERAVEFDEMVDFWLVTAGLTEFADPTAASAVPNGWQPSAAHPIQLTEVRFPDPEVVRSLLIPLLRLR
ncbi:MAG: hypothetical protein ABI586_01910, partial [Candidatus Nanopelagicales bacterium]